MILITGSSGFIGSVLKKQLNGLALEFEVVDRKKIKWPEDLGHLDLKRFQAVIHLATDARTQNVSEGDFALRNLLPVKNLLSSIHLTNPNCLFVFFSSQSAGEKAPNWYGKYKFVAENEIKSSGVPHVIIRPGLVIGDESRGLFGRLMDLCSKIPLMPVVSGGKQKVQPIRVELLCEATIRILNNSKTFENKRFELAEETISFKELITREGNKRGKTVRFISFPKWVVYFGLSILEFLIPSFPVKRENLNGLLELRLMDYRPSMTSLGFDR